MEKIGLVIVSSADLPFDVVEKNQMAVVGVKLFWPEIENLPGENTFQKMRELEKKRIQSFGKTSQPPMKDFLDAFNLQFGKYDKIICIAPTSKLSGTYNSAVQAKKFLTPENQKKVFIVDSLSISGGEALLILRALDLIQLGKNTDEIVKELTALVSVIHFYVMFEDPKWVEASGRMSHLAANFVRSMAKFGIRPVLALKDGILAPAGLKTGAKDLVQGLFKQFSEDMKKIKKDGQKIKVIITHADNLVSAQKLREMIENEFKNSQVVFLNILNNVVGALAGPDTLALAWREI